VLKADAMLKFFTELKIKFTTIFNSSKPIIVSKSTLEDMV
jgi:hypothetical protein